MRGKRVAQEEIQIQEYESHLTPPDGWAFPGSLPSKQQVTLVVEVQKPEEGDSSVAE